MLRKISLAGSKKTLFCRCSSNIPKDKNKNTEEKTPEKPKYDPKDKISQLLKEMIEDNAQRDGKKFQSKFPTENKGYRKSQLPSYDFKADDSNETKLKNAASAVAESLGDNQDQVKKELLSKALDIHKAVDLNWSELISGMKVDDEQQHKHTRADEVKSVLKQVQTKRFVSENTGEKYYSNIRSRQMTTLDLKGAAGLGIFTDITNHTTGPELKMWNYLTEKEVNIATTHPPSNYYQKMIMWTKQRKIWKFPIDNEQGMEEENNVNFSDHVFLEPHLDGWCPTKGPVRQFMELVCVGLSKNPYYTVQEKIDHIMWYKDYFSSKIELLQQTEALQDGFSTVIEATK